MNESIFILQYLNLLENVGIKLTIDISLLIILPVSPQ